MKYPFFVAVARMMQEYSHNCLALLIVSEREVALCVLSLLYFCLKLLNRRSSVVCSLDQFSVLLPGHSFWWCCK
jgi:hypothetical protein